MSKLETAPCPGRLNWTGCFLKQEKINSGELLSFKHNSREGQAKLNPKTAKCSQTFHEGWRKETKSKLILFDFETNETDIRQMLFPKILIY